MLARAAAAVLARCASGGGLPAGPGGLASAAARALSTSGAPREEAAPAGVKEFTEAWARIAPSTMNLPEFPSAHIAAESARDAAADGDTFPVNFYTPNGMLAEAKVGGE